MENLKLTNEGIDAASEKMTAYFAENGIDKKEITRNRLLLEEVLISYQEKFGMEKEFSLSFNRIFNQLRCYVRINGESFDPLKAESDFDTRLLGSLLDYEGGTPNWTYRNGCNVTFFVTRKKRKVSFIAKIALALILGVASGLVLKGSPAAANVQQFANDYLAPLANAYTGLLCVMAVLLTFFALPLGINALGNADSFGKFSKSSLLRMYGVMTASILVYFLIFLGRVDSRADSAAISVKALYDILIGFFPTGLVAPFLNFNSIQILIIGVMFGFAFLAMGEKGQKVIELFDSCNLAAILTNNFLNAFIPVYVAISMFTSIVNADFAALGSVPMILLYAAAGFLLLLVFYTAVICVKQKMTPREVVKHFMPGFMIALSSGSFGACFTTIINSMLAFGAEVNRTTFIMNVGGIVFKPAHSITFLVSSVIMAGIFGMPVSVPWLIFAVLLSVILTVAVPNVPGASASVYALLFTQLGLPAEALVLMISVNAFLEFVMVAVNMYCLQGEIVLQARNIDE